MVADPALSTLSIHSGSQQDIPASEDVHTVASLLKLYLRELPDPIIPFSLFNTAVIATKGVCDDNHMFLSVILVHWFFA